MTQFERATKDLGILLITAHSAEAKGRIERLFQILQDRLVKEMRLSCINSPNEENKFLEDIFVSKFNSKFAVAPANDGNVHKALSEIDKKNLNRIFSYLNYAILPERPKKIKHLPLILTTHKLNWKPPENHPWRHYHKTES